MRTRWDAVQAGEVDLPVNRELGFEFVAGSAEEGVELRWTVPEALCNSEGNLQGGMLAAFADSALGAASATVLSDDHYPALAEMKISIFRPAPGGMALTVRGKVLKHGRRLMFVEAEVSDPDGKTIAKATGTSVPIPT